MPEKSVAGFAVSDRKITGGKAVLKTPDGKTHTANLVNVDKKWQFSLPGEPGELTVTLAFQDGKNKVLTQKIAKLPPAPVEVISGPDRRFYINGKVFFPLELARNVVPFKEQVYQGGNYVRRAIPSTPEDCLKILDQGVKDNLKIIFSFMNTVPRTVDENKLRLWQHRAENLLSREVLNHPALLGYFLDDEPLWNGVPLASLQRCYDVLRKADPYRPVLICSAPRGTVDELRPYAMCSDVFGVDIYPVPSPSSHSHLEDKSISCVGKYVRRMQEITDFTRPVFVVLQGCAWGDLGGNKNKPRIYPTLTESRFMAFDAVINQVDMIFWWGLWYSANPEFYDELTQVTREMHSLTGVFAAANHMPGKVSNKAVEYRRFYGSNWSCTIAANTVNKQVKVIFSNVPGVPATEVSFEPYEVKIFSNGTLPSPLTEIPPLDPKRITFKNQLIAKRDAVTYQAPDGMKWIWGAKEKSIPGSRIFARKTFTVKNGLKKAYLRVSVDDFVLSIVLNKQKLDPGTRFLDDYRYLNNLDISSLLKTGSNTLCIEAADGAPLPCGLLAEIRLEYADGFVQSIPSDATWETAPAAEGPWSKASVIKNLGDAPWKMPKLLKPIVPVLVKK
jgi:hypothetical protein